MTPNGLGALEMTFRGPAKACRGAVKRPGLLAVVPHRSDMRKPAGFCRRLPVAFARAVGRVCRLRQLSEDGEELGRLPAEQAGLSQKLDRTHGGAMGLGG